MLRSRTTLAVAVVALLAGVAAVIVAVSAGGGSAAAATPAPTVGDTVTVSGAGTVEGKPDTVVARLRVHVREGSVQQALDVADSDARQVVNSLRSHNVPGADIRTTGVSLDPAYDSHGNLVGYNSGESLTVRIPLTNVGRVLKAAATSAGNSVTIDGVSFDISDDSNLLARARAAAFGNAKAAAQQYAGLGGSALSRVVSIKAAVHHPSPIYGKGLTLDNSAGLSALHRSAVPIRPGRQKLTVHVRVVWALR